MQNLTQSGWRLYILIASLTSFVSVSSAVMVNGTVMRNVDGDTMWVEQGGRRDSSEGRKPPLLKIRMLGIDAPESCFPTTGGCVGQGHFGNDAKEKLAELAPVGTSVRIDSQGIDSYQRTLARVYVKNVDLDLKLIRLGYAIPYIICAGERCAKSFFQKEKVGVYLDACRSARSKGLGVWNPKDPLTEMPFEFRLRMSGRDPDKYVGDFKTRELFEPADYRKVDVCDRIFFPNSAAAEAAGFEF